MLWYSIIIWLQWWLEDSWLLIWTFSKSLVMLVMFDFAIPHFADSRILTCFQPMLLLPCLINVAGTRPETEQASTNHQPQETTQPRNELCVVNSATRPPGCNFSRWKKLSPQADLHEKLWAAVRHGGCDGFLEIPKTRRSGFPAISRICHGFHEAGINPCKSCMELAWQSPPFQDVQVRCWSICGLRGVQHGIAMCCKMHFTWLSDAFRTCCELCDLPLMKGSAAGNGVFQELLSTSGPPGFAWFMSGEWGMNSKEMGVRMGSSHLQMLAVKAFLVSLCHCVSFRFWWPFYLLVGSVLQTLGVRDIWSCWMWMEFNG